MADLHDSIAEIVNEWFQGEPTPERQQNMRRLGLIRELQDRVDRAVTDAYEAGYRNGVYAQSGTDVLPTLSTSDPERESR